MRFKINLFKTGSGKFIPINYQYELSSTIYKIIHQSNSDFAKFLHGQGYHFAGKGFKLFTFSHIKFDKFQVYPNEQRIEHQGQYAHFYISFLIDKAAEEFVKGLFINQQFGLGDKISQIDYEVIGIDAPPPPVFDNRMRYRCLSPLLLKQKRIDGGENYLHPENDFYKDLLVQNLSSKAVAMATSAENRFLLDSLPETEMKLIGKVYKKGIRIKQHTQMATQVIGYLFEFEFYAPIELQEIGYYAGFGHLGSQGFGCVEVKGGVV